MPQRSLKLLLHIMIRNTYHVKSDWFLTRSPIKIKSISLSKQTDTLSRNIWNCTIALKLQVRRISLETKIQRHFHSIIVSHELLNHFCSYYWTECLKTGKGRKRLMSFWQLKLSGWLTNHHLDHVGTIYVRFSFWSQKGWILLEVLCQYVCKCWPFWELNIH